jgi:hypothetical protein
MECEKVDQGCGRGDIQRPGRSAKPTAFVQGFW